MRILFDYRHIGSLILSRPSDTDIFLPVRDALQTLERESIVLPIPMSLTEDDLSSEGLFRFANDRFEGGVYVAYKARLIASSDGFLENVSLLANWRDQSGTTNTIRQELLGPAYTFLRQRWKDFEPHFLPLIKPED